MHLIRPVVATIYRCRRRLATAGVIMLACALGYHVVFGANGMVVYQNKRAEYRDLQRQMLSLQQENERLAQQNTELKTNPAAIEREAREQLHLTRPGETVYVVPPDQQTAPKQPAAPATAQNR
jgi:cell division protein FtsB